MALKDELVDKAASYAAAELKAAKSALYSMKLGRDALGDGHAYTIENRVQAYASARQKYAAARGYAEKIALLTADANAAGDQAAADALAATPFNRPFACLGRMGDYDKQMTAAVAEAAALGGVVGTSDGGPLGDDVGAGAGSEPTPWIVAGLAAVAAGAWWFVAGPGRRSRGGR